MSQQDKEQRRSSAKHEECEEVQMRNEQREEDSVYARPTPVGRMGITMLSGMPFSYELWFVHMMTSKGMHRGPYSVTVAHSDEDFKTERKQRAKPWSYYMADMI